MILTIDIDKCKHLKEISSYNHNYYLLPDGFYIDKCNVIKEICDEDYDSYEYVLGKVEEGQFSDDGNHKRYPSYWGFDICNRHFVLDSEREDGYNT